MISAGYEDVTTSPIFARSHVQDGAGLSPSDRELCSQSTISAWRTCRRSHPAAHGPRHGRSLLRVLPSGPEADYTRHRRFVRRGSWRPAVATLQCALRRIWFSADRRIRREAASSRRCSPANGRAARRSGLPAPPAAAIRANWPNTQILLRATAIIAVPKFSTGAANGLDYILGVVPTRHCAAMSRASRQHEDALRGRAEGDASSAASRSSSMGPKAGSGRADHRTRRSRRGRPDTRFIVTNLKSATPVSFTRMSTAAGQPKITSSRGRRICGRPHLMHEGHGQPAPAVPARRRVLADVGLRASMPRRSMWRVAQFDTLRLRLIKVAARVVEMKTMIRVSCRRRAPPRIFCVSHSAYTAPRHLTDGAAPLTLEPVPSTANIRHPPSGRRRKRRGAPATERNQIRSRERDVLRAVPVRALHNLYAGCKIV